MQESAVFGCTRVEIAPYTQELCRTVPSIDCASAADKESLQTLFSVSFSGKFLKTPAYPWCRCGDSTLASRPLSPLAPRQHNHFAAEMYLAGLSALMRRAPFRCTFAVD